MKEVIRAKSAGFCFGVSLALKKLESALEEYKSMPEAGHARIATLGPIIHNPLLVREYEEAGVACLKNPDEARSGDTIVIRAHGVPDNEEKQLRLRGCRIVDATCPRVKAAQLEIRRSSGNPDNVLLLFGEPEHPEVLGLVSYSACPYFIFSDLEELDARLSGLEPWLKQTLAAGSGAKLILAAQTTQDKEKFAESRENITRAIERAGKNWNGNFIVLETICDATRKRQDELLDLTRRVEAVVVVGGKNSGNTRRLAELAEGQNIPTLHIENAGELDRETLRRFRRIGLTAGASTPAKHIDIVENLLLSL